MGNIIGENINLNVQEQIEIRQNSLSSSNKTSDDLHYQNKTSWLRLASSVDLSYKEGDIIGKETTEKLTERFKKTIGGDVSGNALARRFVLFNTINSNCTPTECSTQSCHPRHGFLKSEPYFASG